MKILVVNGPNLNMLGNREQGHYGTLSLDEINKNLSLLAHDKHQLEFFQSNIEGEIINRLQVYDFDGLIINGGGYSHYSVAIRDALSQIKVRKVEVHLSNIFAREEFRQNSLFSAVCDGVICGLKEQGYYFALEFLLHAKK